MTSPAPRRGRTLSLAGGALAALLAAALPPTARPAPAQPGAEAAQKGSASYSLGVIMGEQLRGSGVTADAVSAERIAQGVRDALNGKHTPTETDRRNMMELLRTAQESAVDTNHHAAATFLAANAKKPGIITTASGLEYKVLSPGQGDSPKPSDEVTVHYRGRLLDGTEFDSSYKRGEPATFRVDRVIPGWTEALQLMKPGGRFQLYIPPQLAYDQRSRPPIPLGSMLIFDVELLSVKPAAAAAPAPAPAPKP